MSGPDGSDQVWGLISTLVGGPAVWGGIGFGVDRFADTVVFTPVGVVVGFVTSFYIVYVKTTHQPQQDASPGGDVAARQPDTGDDAPS